MPFRFLAGRQVGEFLIASRDLFPCFPGDRIDSPCNLRLGLTRLLEMVLAAFGIDHVDTPILGYPNVLVGTWFLGPGPPKLDGWQLVVPPASANDTLWLVRVHDLTF